MYIGSFNTSASPSYIIFLCFCGWNFPEYLAARILCDLGSVKAVYSREACDKAQVRQRGVAVCKIDLLAKRSVTVSWSCRGIWLSVPVVTGSERWGAVLCCLCYCRLVRLDLPSGSVRWSCSAAQPDPPGFLENLLSCSANKNGNWSCFPGGSEGKTSAYNAGDPGSIPGSGRSAGEGNGNPLQYLA